MKIVRSAVFPIIVLILASVGFVSSHVAEQTAFSPFDEFVYLDYLAKVPTQGIVYTGDETGAEARNAISCRGVQYYGAYGEGCDTGFHNNDGKYPYDGGTGASIYAPLYFAITWAAAQPLTLLGVGLLDAGRFIGGLWLSLGTVGVYVLLRLLRIHRLSALGLSLVVLSTPAVLWASVYISTDAPTLGIAAAVGCVAVLVAKRRINLFWLPAISIVAVLFKVQNLAAVIVAGIALLVLGLLEALGPQSRASGRGFLTRLVTDKRVLGAILAVVSGAAAQVGWLLVRSANAVPGVPAAVVDSVRLPLSLQGLLDEVFRFLRTVGQTDAVPTTFGIVLTNTLTLVVIASVIGLIVEWQSRPATTTSLAVATLVAALLLGPALAMAVYLSAGFYFPLPARYGMALLPAFMACIALYFSRFSRTGPWVTLAIGGTVFAGAVLFA
ncbi:hypothetical protein E3T25_03605 [Cryobacterium sandaracinum]|uniref:DUF2142 domain-containing protein n=2 Tax=Cryobacterium TaxID=69578 RepID=A0ABY2JKN0_9MICO|nr:hypothetical protein [Cryobacterium sandaracinum]TFD05743.1 hypothetical protein E3T25_03605 [Cryobacterium sandaracinum]